MRRVLKYAVVLASFVAGGLVYAQVKDDAPPDDDADVTAPSETQAQLSPREMTQNADRLIAEMREGLEKTVELQQFARKQKDVIKLNCVNDKLLQLKQLLNIAEAARTDLSEAIASADEEARYHEYGQIVITSERVGTLVGEAQNCVGEELIYLGPTDVDVDKPDMQDDPAGEDDALDVEPPAYASPFF